jgi:hypothetical protein
MTVITLDRTPFPEAPGQCQQQADCNQMLICSCSLQTDFHPTAWGSRLLNQHHFSTWQVGTSWVAISSVIATVVWYFQLCKNSSKFSFLTKSFIILNVFLPNHCTCKFLTPGPSTLLSVHLSLTYWDLCKVPRPQRPWFYFSHYLLRK